MSTEVSPRVARAKEIGVDVEFRVVDALGPVRVADDSDAYYDAVTTSVLAPDTVAGDLPIRFGVPLLEVGTEIETKSAKRRTSNGGDQTIAGRWLFKGRDDGQHAKLLEASAYYALSVYDDVDGDRELLAVAVVPASIVDELLRDRWYSIDRSEGTLARLSWTHVFDRLGGDGR
ncbi:hypothetical protein [Halobellus captivus]|uniref:hypothetical protein n=1 Tax=Halobellus captivus TaxID=2592614 RepID=UPI00119E75CF|nr:hypothetical protein [Halobellus captivus]